MIFQISAQQLHLHFFLILYNIPSFLTSTLEQVFIGYHCVGFGDIIMNKKGKIYSLVELYPSKLKGGLTSSLPLLDSSLFILFIHSYIYFILFSLLSFSVFSFYLFSFSVSPFEIALPSDLGLVLTPCAARG